MKMLIAAAAIFISMSAQAGVKPFDKGQSMTFECQTGAVIHVVDDKNVVLNGDSDAQISSLTDERLQAQGHHGPTNLTTSIDLRYMGMGYYSLLDTELDQNGSQGPWDDKVLGATALICQRTK